MTTDNEVQKTIKEKAIDYCKDLIEYYKSYRNNNRTAWYLSQSATVILSATTPILILAEAPKVVSAIPPALASITGGLSVFRWKENWVIGKSTQEALEAELVSFDFGVTDYYRAGDSLAVDTFISRVNTLHLGKVKEWSTFFLEDKPSNFNSD